MDLGPIQKQWMKELKEYPERQMKDSLGKLKQDGTFKACCLGMALIILENGIENVTDSSGCIIDRGEENMYEEAELSNSFQKLGLLSPSGEILNPYTIDNSATGNKYTCLALANDDDMTWPQIAEWVENNPEKVFTKSV